AGMTVFRTFARTSTNNLPSSKTQMQEQKDPIMKNEATVWESVMTARMAHRWGFFEFSVIKIQGENSCSLVSSYRGMSKFGKNKQNWGQ
ncbi:MAG: hypothetical protein QME78_05870, partial [Thermodesulfobacteriota bacterium]|nr:hypothetical protein [Thermodesulfobacteriota bacterium]